jgi:hypothetical protein
MSPTILRLMLGTLEPVILRGSMSKQRLSISLSTNHPEPLPIFLRKAADLIARILRLTLSHECDAEPRPKTRLSIAVHASHIAGQDR